MPRPHTHQHRQTLYAEAIDLIRSSAGERLTIDDVARGIATSRRQLQRVFEEVGGVSFRDVLAAERAERAARMLAGGLPVGEVARRTGYEHASHFARAFKRRHGVTPSQFARTG